MDKKTTKALGKLVQDHKLQAGISLAVALGVWHFKGHEGMRQPVHKVGEIVDLLKEQDRLLISDEDSILHIIKAEVVSGSLVWVSRIAYIGAVILLAANAIDIQRQIREPEPEKIKKLSKKDKPKPHPTSYMIP